MGLLTPVLCLVALVVFFLLLVRYALHPVYPVKGKTNVPGPTEGIRWPIIGDALMFAGVKHTKDLWEQVRKLCLMRESIISFYMGPKLLVWVFDAHIVETLIKLNKCPDKDEEFNFPFQYVMEGVFSSSSRKTWVDLRRPLDKLMHQKKMDDFMVVFLDKAKMACDKVQRLCGRGVFDMREVSQYYTTDIALEIFFGLPSTQQVEDTMGLPDKLSRCVPLILLRMTNPFYNINWIFQSSSLGRQTNKIMNELRPILEQIVDDCFEKMKERGFDPNDPTFEPQNYVEVAIQVGLREKKSRDKLLFSVVDMMLAAYDTSSVVIATAILYLAMHPNYQEKVYQEQLSVMGDSLEGPTRAELSRMDYLEMVFNETNRKVSPPTISKRLRAEIQIDDYVIPENTTIAFMFNKIHSSPKYWERPGDFYPDHFLPENVAKRPKCAFLPFSFGIRSCPGKMFGIASSKLILSMLLRRFKFTTTLQYKDISYEYMIMVECEQGYPVEATPRVNSSGL